MRFGVLVTVLGLACATTPQSATNFTAAVTALELDFASREHGALAFTLQLPAEVSSPPAVSVSWELFLDGIHFASGIEENLLATPQGVIWVRSALLSRHLGWREGEGWLDVKLEGKVGLGVGAPKFLFGEKREMRVHGRPQLLQTFD